MGKRSPIPAEITHKNIIALCDSREQAPLDLAPLKVERSTLATGDYSIRGCERIICIERKSLPDLVACVGVERERFDREMARILAYPCRALVIEATWDNILNGTVPSEPTPEDVCHQVLEALSDGQELPEQKRRWLIAQANHALNPPKWRSEVTPAAALGSLLGWIMAGVPVLMARDHATAGRYVARMLLLAARRRWRENRALLAVLDEVPAESPDKQ